MKVTLALLSAVAVALARPSPLSGMSLEKRYWFEECRDLLTKDPKAKCDPGRDDDDPAAPWRIPDIWRPPAEREKKKAEDAENEKKKNPEQKKADKDKDDQRKAQYDKDRNDRRARAKGISDEELTRRDRETEEREKKWHTCRVALLKNRNDPCDPGPLPPFEYKGWPKEIKEIFDIMRDREKAREEAEWQKMSPEERKKKEKEDAEKKAAGEAAVQKAKQEMDDRAAAAKKADDEKAADKKADDGKAAITKAEFVKAPVKKAGWLEAR
ncbi:hypothetical protein AAL_05520 [Moelleriella libera RCEF 2490]|uniref:Uncharacterized protein n=1 Tax=Moelleriella libera RCEF 2490 TaxID=1081109 RepID=A0A168ADS7_9HYPO|nr:hypothetical protein AAL_05520 [Moelleriella libera RCEF 2490]